MKIAGIVCEYNPFHTGHKYQIDMLKKDFDAAVCIMSGSFVQRGEVAVFDKWTRTEAALSGGCDLVLELPVRYSLACAEIFAHASVEILDKTGVIDVLSFGSECGDIAALSNASRILKNEPEEYSLKIKEYLNSGMSLAAAREKAFSGVINPDIITLPNNILAIEYLAALESLKSSITPITHKRSVGYNSQSVENGFASASLLRRKIKSGEDISEFSSCKSEYIYDTDRLSDIFRYLLTVKKEALFENVADVEPGLAQRFVKFADAGSFSDIIDSVCTKRYSKSHLRRIALCAIIGIYGGYVPPQYVRVLGFNQTGAKILSKMKTTCSLPVVNKVADFKNSAINEDISATDIAALCSVEFVPSGRDFTTSPVNQTGKSGLSREQ